MKALVEQLNDAYRNYFKAAHELDHLEGSDVDSVVYDEAFDHVIECEFKALDAAIALADELGKPIDSLEDIKQSPGKRMMYFMGIREKLAERWG